MLRAAINVIKSTTSCLIHSMVYRENEKLFLCLDELDAKVMNDNGYKEALILKHILNRSWIHYYRNNTL
jgi:hypothetical protein